MAITNITKERALHMASLVYDFNAKLAPYITAQLVVTYACSYITIFFEYGKRGFGRIEQYTTLPNNNDNDEGLKEAEKRMERLMEEKWDV